MCNRFYFWVLVLLGCACLLSCFYVATNPPRIEPPDVIELPPEDRPGKKVVRFGTWHWAGNPRVEEIVVDSFAFKAGVQRHDIITEIGSFKISDSGQIRGAIASYPVGSLVWIRYMRDGTEIIGCATTKLELEHD